MSNKECEIVVGLLVATVIVLTTIAFDLDNKASKLDYELSQTKIRCGDYEHICKNIDYGFDLREKIKEIQGIK